MHCGSGRGGAALAALQETGPGGRRGWVVVAVIHSLVHSTRPRPRSLWELMHNANMERFLQRFFRISRQQSRALIQVQGHPQLHRSDARETGPGPTGLLSARSSSRPWRDTVSAPDGGLGLPELDGVVGRTRWFQITARDKAFRVGWSG